MPHKFVIADSPSDCHVSVSLPTIFIANTITVRRPFVKIKELCVDGLLGIPKDSAKKNLQNQFSIDSSPKGASLKE